MSKLPLNPSFAPVHPPRWKDAAPGAPVLGQPRFGRMSMQIEMSFYGGDPDLVVRVNAPTQRVARRAALIYARTRHSPKRITELNIYFVDGCSVPVDAPALA